MTARASRRGITPRRYTAADDAEIVRRRAAGESSRQIGAALGRSPASVRVRMSRMPGHGSLVLGQAERAGVVALLARGYGAQGIGRRLGYSWPVARRWIAVVRAGIRGGP